MLNQTTFTKVPLDFNLFLNGGIILGYVGLLIFTTLLAGFYPSFVVSKFQPIQSLQEYVARVVEPISGRQLTLYSDQPSVILYTGNYLNTDSKTDDKNFVERHLKKRTDNILNKSISISDKRRGKNNTTYQAQQGLCLEPQRAFNHSISNDNYQAFASCLLTPEQPFYSKSIYVFDVIKKR